MPWVHKERHTGTPGFKKELSLGGNWFISSYVQNRPTINQFAARLHFVERAKQLDTP